MSSKSQSSAFNTPSTCTSSRKPSMNVMTHRTLSCKMPKPHSLPGLPHAPAQSQALNLDLSASMSTLFSLCCAVRESVSTQVPCTGQTPGGCCNSGPSYRRSSPPSPVAPPHSAGSCRCWLELPPTWTVRGDRDQTHRESSHCHSTGRARAPRAGAAARLPHRHPPPSHPSSTGPGRPGRDSWVLVPEQVCLCEATGPGPAPWSA